MTKPPFRPIAFVTPRVEVARRADGSIVLKNPYPCGEPPPNAVAPLRRWAEEAGARTWLAERATPDAGWTQIAYAQGEAVVASIASALVRRGMGQETPLMILSGNSLEHAVMNFGAMAAGVPVAPVSRAYSLMSSDFEKLLYVVDLIRPRMIFVQDGLAYEKALNRLNLDGVEVVYVQNAPAVAQVGATLTPDAELTAERRSGKAEDAYRALTHASVGKYLFTSGSTGMPKAVINTHGMMAVNSVMAQRLIETWETDEPTVALSFLPWSHTFGGNSVMNGVMSRGGTLYLDDGAPQPGLFDRTIRNLKEIAPTSYSTVPVAYTWLAEALERDEALARNFFSRLRSLAYGGAALAQDVYDRIQAVAARTTGERIVFTTGYGATETGPTVMSVHWATERMGLLGLPLPGIEIKLQPIGEKYDVRVRGPAVTPGYYKRPDLTAKAFDAEGFYSLGDAAKFVDPDDPVKGLVFNGRIAEDFKLDTGTWVNAGRLRVQAVEGGRGLIQDALVAGLDRPYVGILAWPNLAACRALMGDPAASLEAVCRDVRVLTKIAEGLGAHNAANPGSSTQIRRAILMPEPPSLDVGEITDKGYVNQAVALGRRRAEVERLYADPPGAGVVASKD
jgi:feruloyl-CoA synthase